MKTHKLYDCSFTTYGYVKGSQNPYREYYLKEDADAEIATLREKLNDIQEVHDAVMAEDCAGDEVHCICVPVLRAEIKPLREKLAQLEQKEVKRSICGLVNIEDYEELQGKLARLVEALEEINSIEFDLPAKIYIYDKMKAIASKAIAAAKK